MVPSSQGISEAAPSRGCCDAGCASGRISVCSRPAGLIWTGSSAFPRPTALILLCIFIGRFFYKGPLKAGLRVLLLPVCTSQGGQEKSPGPGVPTAPINSLKPPLDPVRFVIQTSPLRATWFSSSQGWFSSSQGELLPLWPCEAGQSWIGVGALLESCTWQHLEGGVAGQDVALL